MTSLILQSCLETLLMISASTVLSIIIGIPLAVLLWTTSPYGLSPHPYLKHAVGGTVNAIRSIPYIILVVLLMPLTRALVGSSIGTLAAIIPLSLAGALLVTRMVKDAFRNVDRGLIEVGL